MINQITQQYYREHGMFNCSLIRNHLRLSKTWRWIRTTYYKLTTLREWYIFKWIEDILKHQQIYSVLDLGCGYGQHSIKIAQTHPTLKVLCIEQDVKCCESIQQAKKNFALTNLSIQNMRIEEFNSDQKFDLILIISVIHYFENQGEILRNITELMKDNSRLLLYHPILPQVGTKLIFLTKSHLYNEYRLLRTDKEFLQNLSLAGLTIERMSYTYGVWGALSFFIFHVFRFKMPFKFFFPIYLISLHFATMVLMAIDYFSMKRRGNGIILIAKKEI